MAKTVVSIKTMKNLLKIGSVEASAIMAPGRLKEIKNRGGEIISLREADEILMNYPEIQQRVTFAMPHLKLGEEVPAALV